MTDLKKIREDILDRSLIHIVFEGWSWKALNVAAKEIDVSSFTLKRAFPKGPRDLITYFCENADRIMLEELNQIEINTLSVREKIAEGIKVRLRQNSNNKEAIRKLLSYFTVPGNIMIGVNCFYRTVDAIWYFAGDTSTDFNFYTKRGLLFGIYTSTLLYWLNDQSEGCTETWDFLDRRIAEVMQIPSLKASIKRKVSKIPSPFRGGLSKFTY